MTIKVEEREDGSFDIEWNENDPVESMMNTWTENDFIDTISNYLDELKQNGTN